MRLREVTLATGLTLCQSLPASAQGAFDVDCPPLDDEARAELAARVQAELRLRQTNTYASVVCQTDTVYLALVDGRDTRRSELRLTEPNDVRPLKDRILDRLGAIAAARDQQPLPARPIWVDSEPNDEPMQYGSREPDAWSLWLLAGAKGESWGGDALGSIGPRLGIGASRSTLSIGLIGTLAWGVQSPDDLRARTVTPMLIADAFIGENLSLGGGTGLTWVVVEHANGKPEETTIATAMLRIRGRLSTQAVDLSLGPELQISSAKVTANLDDRDVFDIPALTIGIAVELELSLASPQSRSAQSAR